MTKKEGEQLQEEHEHLQQRQTRLVAELEGREASLKIRLQMLNKEKVEAVAEVQEKVASLETQKSFQAQKFKEQIHKLKEDHEEALNLLQRQLDGAEMDNIRLQREIQHLQKMSRVESSDVSSPHEFYPISSHPSEERQEGEGSEIVDPEPIKASSRAPTQSTPFTFEQLIATPMEALPGIKSPTPSVDEETLKTNLVTSQKKIEHLSS
ncbi:hypothetical protein EGW08_012528, partial [Elysia chlorotica]